MNSLLMSRRASSSGLRLAGFDAFRRFMSGNDDLATISGKSFVISVNAILLKYVGEYL